MELGAEAGHLVLHRLGLGIRYIHIIGNDVDVYGESYFWDGPYFVRRNYAGSFLSSFGIVQGGVWTEGVTDRFWYRGFFFAGPINLDLHGRFKDELEISLYPGSSRSWASADWKASGNNLAADLGAEIGRRFSSRISGFLGISYLVANIKEVRFTQCETLVSGPAFTLPPGQAYIGNVPKTLAGKPLEFDLSGIRLRMGFRLAV
jgi:hypothetical protein